jgi:hypothetical protein
LIIRNTIHKQVSKRTMDNATQNDLDVIVVKFADAKIPVFKEARNKDYIKYGEDNLYPEYLNYLFNKSAKHNAIITGKSNYIFGGGFENGDFKINRLNESLNDITRKAILDIEIYGGFRLEIIWNRAGKIGEIYHVDFSTIRVGKEGGFYYKESWDKNNRDEEMFIPAFNPSEPTGSQIYSYNEYRPMVRFYPLPTYIGCNNYIETDIEISKYYLSAIRNGMAPSKMIQFYEGEPSEDKKREIERRFKEKFAGSENAGRFILVFNKQKDKQVDIDDLSGSELDKMFVELNKTCQQEIFSGHLVTSPMLFGIKTEGQLGGNNELQTAYSIFQNTYSKPKAEAFEREIEYLLAYSNYPGEYELQPTDPIGIQFDIKDVVNSLPKQFVFEKLGIPKELWNAPNIGSDNKPSDTPAKIGAPPNAAPGEQMANDNIKNLTPKQHNQLTRIIREYSKGKLTEAAARTLLKTGLLLSDEEINNILGISVAMSAHKFSDVEILSLLGIKTTMSAQNEDDVIAMFDACGESKKDFEIIKSKKVVFDIEEIEEDENVFIQAFAYDVTTTENEILELIKKDPKITPEVIAGVIEESEAFVKSKIAALVKKGYLEEKTVTVGEDLITERTIPEKVTAPPIKTGQTNPTKISIKYSYEGPQDSKNRPFCAKMMKLNRLYSRSEIEQISGRLGYSVFDRRGGFWNDHGTIHPYCRHHWKSNIVIKKS